MAAECMGDDKHMLISPSAVFSMLAVCESAKKAIHLINDDDDVDMHDYYELKNALMEIGE
jgi:hypothetical protein